MKNTAFVKALAKGAVFAAFLWAVPGVFGQAGLIKEVTGTVELKPAGASAFVPAKAGDTVARDTVVSTGFKSSAVIQTGSSSIFVRPLTRLSLAEIQASPGVEEINVSLQAGRVRVDVNPPLGARAGFTVKSPIATASVRGTSFEFDTRNLHVREGTVRFRGTGGAVVLVRAGHTSRAEPRGRAADPLQTAEAALFLPAPAASDAAAPASSTPQIKIGLEFVFN